MANTHNTTTRLALARTTVLKGLITPSLTTAPFFDLAARIGELKEVGAGFVKESFWVPEALQYVDGFGAMSAPTANVYQGFEVPVRDSISVPVQIDERDPAISDAGSLIDLQKDVLDAGVANYMSKMCETYFSSTTWDGSAYNLPMCGIQKMLPNGNGVGDAGTYYGVDRALTASFRHYWADTTHYSTSTTACVYPPTQVVDEFISPAAGDGLIEHVLIAAARARTLGGSNLVCFVHQNIINHLTRYINTLNLGSSAAVVPAWVPTFGGFADKKTGVTVGAVGYDYIVYHGILFVAQPGCLLNTAYLIPFVVNGRKNVVWVYNKNVNSTAPKSFPMISISEWIPGQINYNYVAKIHTSSNVYIRNLAPCAVMTYDGTYTS